MQNYNVLNGIALKASMIRFYKRYQYDKWYDSLTNEEKEKLKEEQELRSKKADMELCSALTQLSFLMEELLRRALY